MDNWKRIIGNDPENDDKLAYEIYHEDKLVCMIRSKKVGVFVTLFEKDIDIPFSWFFEAIQEAKNRIH
jgi:hypothetical protein